MRIEQLLKLLEEFEDITLEIEDRPGELMTNMGEPVKYLYRIVSKQEYAEIKETGIIKGRVRAAAIPIGGDRNAFKVLKIKYTPTDGWKAKDSRVGVIAVTNSNVPADRIVDEIPLSIINTNAMLNKTRFNQYMEYQAR